MTSLDSDITVAVWMVTYNHEAFIEQAIESVMMQKTSFAYKLFVGEDCSTDATQSICKKLKETYPNRIELFLNDTNLGHSKNGINIYKKCYESAPKYIAMLEGDDYWTDSLKLQKQVDFLEEHPDYGMCFTRFKTYNQASSIFKIDNNTQYFQGHHSIIDFNFDTFAKGWHVGLQTLLFKKDLFSINLISKYQNFKDIHLIVELLLKKKGACLPSFCAVYRIHEAGLYNSNTSMKNAELGLLSYGELYKKNKGEPLLKRKYMNFYKYYNKALISNKYYFKALWHITKYSILNLDLFYFRTNQMKILSKLFKR